jgi:hypothetical protein
MRHGRLPRLVGTATFVFLATAPAHAATPLPNPPFADGGFVAPSYVTYKQEYYALRTLVAYSARRLKCDLHALGALTLAYTPNNPTKIADVQSAWTACIQYVDDYYTRYRDRLLVKGTPACLDLAGLDALRATLDQQAAQNATVVFCDGSGAAPDPVTGLDVPGQKPISDGEIAAATVLWKATYYADRCYLKFAGLALKEGGTLTPADVSKAQACVAKAATLGDASMASQDQKQKLPSCLPLATAQAAVTTAVAHAGAITPAVYCASPSGAFVE